MLEVLRDPLRPIGAQDLALQLDNLKATMASDHGRRLLATTAELRTASRVNLLASDAFSLVYTGAWPVDEAHLCSLPLQARSCGLGQPARVLQTATHAHTAPLNTRTRMTGPLQGATSHAPSLQ
jgi:hypothetical protein